MFVHVDAEEAAELNAQGKAAVLGVTAPVPFVRKAGPRVHPRARKMEAHYAPRIAGAIAAGISGIDTALTAAQIAMPTEKATSDEIEALRQAAMQYLNFDPSELDAVLRDIYGDGWLVGTSAAVTELGANATFPPGMATVMGSFDWSTWAPGNPEAAAQVTSGGLNDLWDAAGITARGIGQTTLREIGTSIGAVIASGGTWRQASDAVQQVISDPARSDLIAITETNRAYVAASLDTYTANGADGFNWVAYDDACEECQAEEDANPHDLSDDGPPEHPSCRCTVEAVFADGSAEAPDTED